MILSVMTSISDGGSQLRAHPPNAKDGGSIPQDTLQSQDGINLGDILFCPLIHTLCMQRLSLNGLCTLLTEGAFTPPQSERPPELSGMTAILLVFQADSRHEKITNIYVGLMVCRVNSCLYSPSQILDFIKDIEGNLKVVHGAPNAGGDPSKWRTYCLFVDNLSSAMSIPMDPPYCLVYPTSYVKGVEPDHFDTCNSPAGMRLHHCVFHATLQFSNDDPKECTKYVRGCLILPHGAQYNDWLYPAILELWNHCGSLIDPTTGEPYPMEVVGDFRAVDPIFKGCYGDSLLYSEADLAQQRWQEIYLPAFQGKIPVPPAPSYQHVREPAATKQSPHRVAAPETSVESPKAKHSSSKGRPQRGSRCSSNTSTPKRPILCLPRNPLVPRNQPWMTRQSLHRPAALASAAVHPLLPQGQ